jgi:hypothetical protein
MFIFLCFQHPKFLPSFKLREWRSAGGLQASIPNNPQPIHHDPAPSPTTSSRKRQKISQSVPPLAAPPPVMHPQQMAPAQPSSSAKKGFLPGPNKGKKTKPVSRYFITSLKKQIVYFIS